MFIITRFDVIGGAQIHVRELSKVLYAKGHSVLVCAGAGGDPCDDLEQYGVQCTILKKMVYPIHPIHDLFGVMELRSEIRKFKPDVISTHSSKAGVLGRIAAYSLGVPVLYTPHGWAFDLENNKFKKYIYIFIERLMARMTSRTINVSHADKNMALINNISESEQQLVVHNAMPDIDPRFYATPEREPVTLLMVARFVEQKDHQALIHALNKIKDLNWNVVFVGDGPLMADNEKLATQYGIADRINFAGYQRNVEDYYSNASIYVLITHWEGFPRSIIEAMRAKLPIIASNVGGVSESVYHQVNGFVVEHLDYETLAKNLRQLCIDPVLRKSMGEESRKMYENDLMLDALVNKMEDIYTSVSKTNRTDGGEQ